MVPKTCQEVPGTGCFKFLGSDNDGVKFYTFGLDSIYIGINGFEICWILGNTASLSKSS